MNEIGCFSMINAVINRHGGPKEDHFSILRMQQLSYRVVVLDPIQDVSKGVLQIAADCRLANHQSGCVFLVAHVGQSQGARWLQCNQPLQPLCKYLSHIQPYQGPSGPHSNSLSGTYNA